MATIYCDFWHLNQCYDQFFPSFSFVLSQKSICFGRNILKNHNIDPWCQVFNANFGHFDQLYAKSWGLLKTIDWIYFKSIFWVKIGHFFITV
jgi:hypothetical protein